MTNIVCHRLSTSYPIIQTASWRIDRSEPATPLPAALTLSVGKQKEPISHERLVTLTSMSMQERAAVSDALLTSRNHGIVLSGTLQSARMTWAIGAFNDWIDSDESFSNTSTEFTGRVTWAPAMSQDRSNLLHVGLGLCTSNAKEPIRLRAKPEFNRAPQFVDTDEFAADRVTTFNPEVYWRYDPYFVGFEYVGSAHAAPASISPTEQSTGERWTSIPSGSTGG